MNKLVYILFIILPLGLFAQTTVPIEWTGLNGMLYDAGIHNLTNNNTETTIWKSSAQATQLITMSGDAAEYWDIAIPVSSSLSGMFYGLAQAPIGTGDNNFTNMKYAIVSYMASAGIYENGTAGGGTASALNTSFRIHITPTSVTYFIGGVGYGTSSAAPTFPLYISASGINPRGDAGQQANIKDATVTHYTTPVEVVEPLPHITGAIRFKTGAGAIRFKTGAMPLRFTGSGTKVDTATTHFLFSLDTSSMTSALVFDKDSNLIRTLWSGIRYPAGSFDTAWDGRKDDGSLADDGNYVISVTSNNISAAYLGVIGNNSDSTHGPTVWRTQNTASLTFPNAHTGYAVIRNTEGTKFLFKFDTLHIHQKTPIWSNTQYQTSSKSCTDGNRIYIVSTWPHATINDYYVHCLFAMDVAGDTVYNFSAGSDAGSASVNIHSALDTVIIPTVGYTKSQTDRIPEAPAVQKKGSLLFDAQYGGINVLDKTSGAFIARSNIVGTNLVCDTSGFLWVDSVKYSVNSSGIFTRLFAISGVVYPMGMDVSPDNSTIIVIDGYTQQVKAYNNLTGAYMWTLGQLWGYYGNTVVANDKFYFKDDRGDYFVSVTFQPDGSFWVNDAGNNRLMHFNADRSYKDFIMYQPSTYFASVDPANISHAYMGYLRFDMDYSIPNKIQWSLARNYGARRTISNPGVNQDYDRPVSYFTLSNGRTYTAIGEYSHQDQTQFEVTDTGFRKTGIILSGTQMDSVGNILQFGYNNGQSWNIYLKKIMGFDGNNNPYYQSYNLSSEYVPSPDQFDPVYAGPINLGNRFSDSSFPFQDNGLGNIYHVGILKHGSSKWKIRTARPTSSGYFGPFPTNGYYDIGNTVQNAAAISTAHKDILYNGYNGEFWKQTQANMFNLFYKNGAFLYQFGQLGTRIPEEAAIGYAGNAKYSNVVTVPISHFTYLFHQDESIHSGLLYWGVYNTDKIVTKTYAIVKRGTPVITFNYERLMEGLAWHTELPDNDVSGWIRNRPVQDNNHVYIGQASWEQNDLPDMFCFYNGSFDSSRNITKTLATAVTNSDWTFGGQVLFDFNSVATNATSALEVLDDANKIIARLTMLQDSSNAQKAVLAMNDRFLGSFNKPNGTVYKTLPDWTGFNFKTVGSTLQVTYNSVTLTTTALVDGSANIHRAKSVRLNFTGNPGSNGKGMGIKNLTFSRN